MTFLRPKPGQSPTTATFEVPLTFNKLDFRDYLYHLYNVETTSVRSFINQRMPAQRAVNADGNGGQWYRPRAQKLMIADLVQPFAWPARPSEDAMSAWDHKLFVAGDKSHKRELDKADALSSWGPQPMRTQATAPRDRHELHRQAEALLRGKQRWAPGLEELVAVERKTAEEEEDGEGAARVPAPGPPRAALEGPRVDEAAVAKVADLQAVAALEAGMATRAAKESAQGAVKGRQAHIEMDGRKP